MSNQHIYLTYQNETKSLKEWADQSSLSYMCLWQRYRAGWPVDEILNTPLEIRSVGVLVKHVGIELTIAEWSRRTELKSSTICMRLQNGWSVAETLTIPRYGRRTLKTLEKNDD